ncbi:MAG: carboxypeptidase regulatory-like domain-containing protein [Gemmatimonadaceae bacterium]|nr:carboxypeptidase regulatory-like domain-containing protein [Gemmatimonadaceae bacterium]
MRVVVPMFVLACLAPGTSPAAQLCTGNAPAGDSRSVHGVVRDISGARVPGAEISAAWTDWRVSGNSLIDQVRTASVVANAVGEYRFCALPRKSSITFRATLGGSTVAVVTVPPGRNTGAVTLPLEPAPTLPARARPAFVQGVVRDSGGAPIPSARISVGEGPAGLSDDAGRFELAVPQAGAVSLVVRRLGYRPRTLQVAAGPSPPVLDLILEPIAAVLRDVTVAARPGAFEMTSGFSERRRRGTGAFFDRAALDRMRPQTLTDVLRSVGGIQVHTVMTRWGHQTTPSSTRASGGAIGCSLDYYVNGHEYTPTSLGIDRDMAPDQIEAIEVYKASEIPPQFLGRRSRCGVVVIWTRYRAHELPR